LPDISANPPDLPPPDTKRWVARRKAAIVNAVRSGEMNIEDACRYYKLSTEELPPGSARSRPMASLVCASPGFRFTEMRRPHG